MGGTVVHPVSSGLPGDMRGLLVRVVLRLRRSGWDPGPSWEGSRRTGMVAGRCMRHTLDENRTLAGRLVSWTPRVVIRSLGDL